MNMANIAASMVHFQNQTGCTIVEHHILNDHAWIGIATNSIGIFYVIVDGHDYITFDDTNIYEMLRDSCRE